MLVRSFIRRIRLESSICFEYQASLLSTRSAQLILRRTFSMTSTQRSSRPIGKKLVIACDGTWQNSDAGFEKSPFSPPKAQIPTNVTRICRALNHQDENGVPQIVYYQRGVGSDGDLENKLVGGLTGNDISEHIREAYGFMANNFDPATTEDMDAALEDESKAMDEIVILGFSRGAYTARAISSLMTDMGLLTKLGMEQFWGIFNDWKTQDIDGKQSEWFKVNYKQVADDFEATNGRGIIFTDPEYRNTLKQQKLTRWGMPIRAVGVWDTVGSLGIPMRLSAKNVKPYSFVNTKVAQHVEYAFHAVAIDERRNLFSPTVWEQPDEPNMLKKLKQCWFPGAHSNIGGGEPDAGISNISLAWMISQLEENGKILSFKHEYLDFVQDLANKWYIDQKQPIRPWGFGTLYDNAIMKDPTSFVEGLHPIDRTPGGYEEIDSKTGKQDGVPLKNTHEFIHRCVRERIEEGGPGIQALGLKTNMIEESKSYKPKALSNYTLVDDKTDGGAYWQAHDGRSNLLEDELGELEIRMLERSKKFQGKTKL